MKRALSVSLVIFQCSLPSSVHLGNLHTCSQSLHLLHNKNPGLSSTALQIVPPTAAISTLWPLSISYFSYSSTIVSALLVIDPNVSLFCQHHMYSPLPDSSLLQLPACPQLPSAQHLKSTSQSTLNLSPRTSRFHFKDIFLFVTSSFFFSYLRF